MRSEEEVRKKFTAIYETLGEHKGVCLKMLQVIKIFTRFEAWMFNETEEADAEASTNE